MLDFHGMSISGRIFLILVLVGISWTLAFAARNSIVLVTLDTTRADRMGFLGSTQKLTPNLDIFAREAVVFTRAYSQVPLTTSSHATILTGTFPQFHNVNEAGVPLSPDLPYAPQILHDNGYRTAAFVASLIMQANGGGAPGFDRGFDEYNGRFHSPQPGESRYLSLERRGGEVVAEALAWIKQNSKSPFFVWIHLYDPHAPYEPPEPFASRFRSSPYDGEIAYMDSVLGRLFGQLRTLHAYDNSVIAVMADHGEALGEHGERGHGLFVYDTTVRVPLIIKLPGQRSSGKRVRTQAELVDVLPTLLDLVGVPRPNAVQGRSLLPVIDSVFATKSAGGNTPVNDEEQPAYSETDYPRAAYGWSPLRALRTGKYAFVQAPRPELYDQSHDPGEEHNLVSSSLAVSSTLAVQLKKFRESTSHAPGSQASLDPRQQAQLRALGYVSSSGLAEDKTIRGIDPKDKVDLSNEMTQAAFELEDGKHEQAIRKLKALLEKDPKLLPAYEALAVAWMRSGNPANAISTLREATAQFPEWAQGHLQLATLLIQARDLNAAEREMKLAADGMPTAAEVRYQLARLYFNLGNLVDAKSAALRARELQPQHYEANLMLGAIALAEGDASASIPYFEKASSIQPEASKPHEYLSRAYSKLGNEALAKQQQSLAVRLKEAEDRSAP